MYTYLDFVDRNENQEQDLTLREGQESDREDQVIHFLQPYYPLSATKLNQAELYGLDYLQAAYWQLIESSISHYNNDSEHWCSNLFLYVAAKKP